MGSSISVAFNLRSRCQHKAWGVARLRETPGKPHISHASPRRWAADILRLIVNAVAHFAGFIILTASFLGLRRNALTPGYILSPASQVEENHANTSTNSIDLYSTIIPTSKPQSDQAVPHDEQEKRRRRCRLYTTSR